MLHFIYTDEFVKRDRSGNTTRRCTIYRVKRNVPVFAARREYTYEDKSQAFMITAEQYKLMPKAAFERSVVGGHKHSTWSLKEAGIAIVTEV